MTEFQILLTVMLSGFGFMGALMLIIWNRIEVLENKLGTRIDKTNERIDKLGDKVEDIDRRLCRIEGSLTHHGHCLFNQVQPEKRAE